MKRAPQRGLLTQVAWRTVQLLDCAQPLDHHLARFLQEYLQQFIIHVQARY